MSLLSRVQDLLDLDQKLVALGRHKRVFLQNAASRELPNELGKAISKENPRWAYDNPAQAMRPGEKISASAPIDEYGIPYATKDYAQLRGEKDWVELNPEVQAMRDEIAVLEKNKSDLGEKFGPTAPNETDYIMAHEALALEQAALEDLAKGLRAQAEAVPAGRLEQLTAMAGRGAGWADQHRAQTLLGGIGAYAANNFIGNPIGGTVDMLTGNVLNLKEDARQPVSPLIAASNTEVNRLSEDDLRRQSDFLNRKIATDMMTLKALEEEKIRAAAIAKSQIQ